MYLEIFQVFNMKKICFLLNQAFVYIQRYPCLDNPISIIHHYSLVTQNPMFGSSP